MTKFEQFINSITSMNVSDYVGIILIVLFVILFAFSIFHTYTEEEDENDYIKF